MNRFPFPRYFLLLVCLSVNALSGNTSSAIPQIDGAVHEFMEEHEIPGLSIAITRKGRLIYAKGYGFADREQQEWVTTESRFRIASLSKPITAVAIFKLIEEGKLSLNTKVFGPFGLLGPKYGMANPDHPITEITILHLLQHTAGGWPNDRDDPTFTNQNFSADELLVWILRNRPLDSRPGDAYAYSNFGYFVLGRVIEEVAGVSYEDYVKSEVLDPMGITSMEIAANTLQERKPDEVIYYSTSRYDPYKVGVARRDSHGGWIATPTDLTRFLLHIDGFNTRRDLLRQSTIRKMTEPSRANPNYASGWSVNEHGNWWHFGSLPGSRAMMVRSSGEFNWAILVNSRGSKSDSIKGDMDRIVWNAINDPSTRWPNVDLFPSVAAFAEYKSAKEEREVLLDVPHVRQEIDMCVPACASAVIRYYGERQSPEKIKRLANSVASDRDFAGTYFIDLVNGLRKIGYEWEERYFKVTDEGFEHGLSEIIRSLDAGKPVLVDTNVPPVGHTILVVGYNNGTQQLILLDPNIRSPGLRQISYSEFKKTWYSLTAHIRGAIFTKPKP